MFKFLSIQLVLILFTLNTGFAQSNSNWRIDYDSARANYNKGNITATIDWLEKFLFENDYKLTDTVLYYEMVNLLGKSYLKAGRNSEGEQMFKEDINYFKTHPEEISRSTYTSSILYLGYLYYNMRRYEEAEQYFEKAIEVRGANLDKKDKKYLVLLGNLAALSHSTKHYAKSDTLYRQLLDLTKIVFKPESIEVAQVLDNYATMYRKWGKYAEAEPMFKQAIALKTKLLTAKHPQTLASQYNLAYMYNIQGRFNEIEPIYKQIIPIAKEIYTPSNNEYTRPINGLADLYKTLGRYKESEVLFTEVSTTREQALGTENLDYTASLINLALLYKAMGEYKKSEFYFLSAISIYEVIIGEFHESYVAALVNLGSLYRSMGRLDEAEPLYVKALDIYKITVGENNISYAKLLNNMAAFHEDQDRFEVAEDNYKKALELTSKLVGQNHPEYATTLNNLAGLYVHTSHFEQAEPLYKESAKIKLEVFGEKHPEYGITLNNLAFLYEEMGRNVEAEPLYLQCVQIFKEKFGTQNPFYAEALINLGGLYAKEKRYTEAENLYQEAVQIIKVVLGDHHPDYTAVINNIALLGVLQGKFNQSEKLFQENLKTIKELKGENSSQYSVALLNLGGVYEHQGKYSEAEKYYVQSLNIRYKIFKPETKPVNLNLLSLAQLYTATGEYSKADTLWDKVLKNYDFQIKTFFPAMSEKEKREFTDELSQNLEKYNSFALIRENKTPAVISKMYNNQLATKGLILNSSNKVRQRIMSSNDQALVDLYSKWLSQREILSKVYALSKEEIIHQGIKVDSIENLANELEKKLSLKSELFKSNAETPRLDWKDVRTVLKPGEAAIEIIRFRKHNFDSAGRFYNDSTYYVALIVSQNTIDHPEMVVLKNGANLEKKFINFYRNAIKFKREDPYSYDNFWKSIGAKLTGINKVFISPDGIYNQISINSLYNKDAQKYVIDELNVRIVSNTKELTAERRPLNPKKQIVLVGNPDYTYHVVASTNTIPEENYQGLLSPLPGTQVEIEGIASTMKSGRWQTEVYTGSQAMEKTLKSLKSPKILHIGTHGFFEKDIDKPEKESGGGEDMVENQLLKSGLMLTGAAITMYNKTHDIYNSDQVHGDHEDGILTAYEAMNLNLDNTDLVILSACETGLGEVRNGEGVYGLQRSFLIAGSKSIIISLWKVNDETTQKLMTFFYTEYLKTPDKALAFRTAQTKLKQEFPEPYYWAAFQMIGE